jgi:hypothetical protein
MRRAIKTRGFVCFVLFLCAVGLMAEVFPPVALVNNVEAVVGRPATPVSTAGVARRTTRRVVGTTAVVATGAAATATAASTAAASQPAAPTPPPVPAAPPPPPAQATAVPVGTVVPALPAGCASVVIGGVSYSDCGGVFYKAAFQGDNLVYVVVPKPMP